MPASDDPSPPEATAEARFATLFQSFFQSSAPKASAATTAYLLERLQPRRGARLLGCDHSVLAYGWGLTAQGCAIGIMAAREDQFDGAIWSLAALGHPPDAALMAHLAERIFPGGRLIIDAGEAQLIGGWAHFPTIDALTPLGVARAPDGRRLYTWLREDRL